MDFSFVFFLVERSALAGSGVGTEPAGFGRKISCSAFPCPRPHHPRSRRISEVASGVWQTSFAASGTAIAIVQRLESTLLSWYAGLPDDDEAAERRRCL